MSQLTADVSRLWTVWGLMASSNRLVAEGGIATKGHRRAAFQCAGARPGYIEELRLSRGTRNAVVWRMAIVLIAWVGTSVVFCLALLAAAARPLPCMYEEMAASAENDLQWEAGSVRGKGRLVQKQSGGGLPTPCRAA